MASPDLVELKCSCRRVMALPRARVLARLKEQKPPRCGFCAKALPIPDEFLREVAAEATESSVRTVGRCPACGQPAQAVGALPAEGVCKPCQLPFWCTGPGTGSFDRPASSPATDAEVREASARLSRVPAGLLISWVFEQRQRRGTLAQGEAARIVDCLERLSRWRKTHEQPFLPLPAGEVLHLLGPVVVRSQLVQVDAERNEVRTTNSLMTGHGPGMSEGTRLGLNAIGIGMMLATGNGFTVSDDRPPPSLLSNEIVYRLQPVEDGTLIGIWSAPAPAVPAEPHPPAEHHEFAAKLFAQRTQLARYFSVLALAGEGLRGPRALRVTARAATQRLHELGRDPAQSAIDAKQLVLSLP